MTRTEILQALQVSLLLVACASGTEGLARDEPGQVAAGTAMQAAGAAAPRLCPANNLTQGCECGDGKPGRQICAEGSGWGGCDCGQFADAEEGTGLRAPAMTPPANLDTAIQFEDYVEVQMLDSGDCKPGTYLGTFDCTYTGDLAPEGFQALGIVSFVLSRSANSEVLTIEDGVIDGWGVMFFFAYLTGEPSCATGGINGTIDDGFYNPLFKGCSGAMGDMPGVNCVITDQSDPNYVAWTPNLEGVYTGTLDPSTDTISGDWTFTPLDIGGSCDGSFAVMRVP